MQNSGIAPSKTYEKYAELLAAVTGLQHDTKHIHYRVNDTTKRIDHLEEQKGRLATRVGHLEMAGSARLRLDSRLEEIPERMTLAESEIQHMRERLKLISAILLAVFTAIVWGTPPEVIKPILKGLLPPGIG
jgi:predicted  nucleic acid-binding Zn-ribbon protein